MTEILEKQFVKCKNRNNGCDWIGRLSELESHIDNECKKQIISCPNSGCYDKIFREEKVKHVAICEYRIVCCEFCEILIAFINIKKHYEFCPKFIMDCVQKCGKQVERNEMNYHIEELCLNTVISCPFTGVGCKHVCAKSNLATHFAGNSSEHLLYMFAYLIKKERSLNSAKENIAKVLDNYQEKIGLNVSGASNKSINDDKAFFFSEQANLVTGLKQSLLLLEQNEARDNNAEIFSFLKVGFIFHNKNNNNDNDEKQKQMNESNGCYNAEYECLRENTNLSSFEEQAIQLQTGLTHPVQENELFREDAQALIESDEKVSNAFIANIANNHKESVGKLNAIPVSVLGKIPGSDNSMLDLNESYFCATERNEKECCSKTKLLGFKRRKVCEEEEKAHEDQKAVALELTNNNNIQINEVKNNSLIMDINN